MKFCLTLTTCLFLGKALTAPLERHDSNAAIKGRHGRRSSIRLPTAEGERHIIIGPNLIHAQPVKYSANWAGAVQISSNVTEISGALTVPNISMPASGSNGTRYGGSAWIGIDGYTCTKAIFQTGIDWSIQDGKPQFHAWYEWFPEYTHNFNMTVQAGDRIKIMAVTHNATGGTAYITNESTNVSVSHTFVGKQPICQENAEWIVEDYSESTPSGSGLIPFAQFSGVRFRNASFCAGALQHGVRGATILDMTAGGKVVTTCQTTGAHSVSCSYQ